jgi:hypothetical protein
MLALAVDQQVVAIEDRVESTPQDPPAADRDEPRPAGGDDVEPFMRPPAVAGGAEFADRPPRPVRAEDGEDVAAVGDAAGARRPRR